MLMKDCFPAEFLNKKNLTKLERNQVRRFNKVTVKVTVTRRKEFWWFLYVHCLSLKASADGCKALKVTSHELGISLSV